MIPEHYQAAVKPVPVTKLVCDGDTYKCTANLVSHRYLNQSANRLIPLTTQDYGDGKWVAQWNTAVFHTGLWGSPDHNQMVCLNLTSKLKATCATANRIIKQQQLAMAPVLVTSLKCDGDSYKCTAKLVIISI